jgi:hypothetical protein
MDYMNDQDEVLNKDSVRKYAWRHYKNDQMFNGDEFDEDMRIFFYIKKLMTRYKKGESDNHHLTLNHIITLNNLFGAEATNKLLHFYVPKEFQPQLNSFLRFLSILPENDGGVKCDSSIDKFLKGL